METQDDKSSRWHHIHKLLWAADENNGIPEAERVLAAKELLEILRSQVDECKRGERINIDPPLITAVESIGRRVFADADPVGALARFLGRKRKRGKRVKNADRDLKIAGDVAGKMYDGMSLDDASAAVGEDCGLSSERVKNIYKANYKKAKAAESLRRLQAPAPRNSADQTGGSRLSTKP